MVISCLLPFGLRGDGLEVVTSYVELPPQLSLPAHTHPGEEFAYVIEGSVYLWEEGIGERLCEAGSTAKLALNQVQTVRSGDEGAKLVVFRIHTIGAPERILVDVT